MGDQTWEWGDAGKGALGGAATGASIGSVGGPWGAAIGGLVGGVGGLIWGGTSDHGNKADPGGMSEADRLRYRRYYESILARQQAPQVQQSNLVGNQHSLIAQLEASASGRAPSLAAEQLRTGMEQNQRAAQSFANGARGSGANLAHYQASNNMANIGAQATRDAGAARIAEITAAQNQLGTVLHGAREQDEALSRANVEAQLRLMGLNDEAIARYFQTLQGRPGMQAAPSTGDALLAGGIGAAGSWAQQRAAQGGGTAGSGSYTPYGDNTINPFEKNPYQGGRRRVAV